MSGRKGKSGLVFSSAVLLLGGLSQASLANVEISWSQEAELNPTAQAEPPRVFQFHEGDTLPYTSREHARNVSVIRQQGDDNHAAVTQSYSTSFLMGNYALIFQHGSLNRAEIHQQGGNNIGVIGQVGHEHDATIVQHGNRTPAIAHIHQFGTASDVSISQSGSGYRSVEVEQHAYSGSALPVTVDTY